MQEIGLQELPQHSPWVARLLGIEAFTPVNRSVEKVQAEYDLDKYKKCLDFYRQSAGDVEQMKQYEWGIQPDATMCVSLGEKLYLATLDEARAYYYRLLAETMRSEIEAVQTVVELGCGYGFNLHMLQQHYPEKQFFGGEYSTNAVALGRELFKADAKVIVEAFNFYDSDYKVLERLSGPAVVFTAHAIEQLPSARHVVERLKSYGCVRSVFHFEPVYELHRKDTVLGLMRRKYAELNDYNRDLLGSLRHAGVRISQNEADRFGLNPFNPSSVLAWAPR